MRHSPKSTRRTLALTLTLATAALLVACATTGASKDGMGFFITSANPGKGGDLGGLAGADQHCQSLAAAAGAGHRTWRAYLSQQPLGGATGVNARDRIGAGPWRNALGVTVASNVEQLHSVNNLSKETALTEKGQVVSGRGDTPNNHDILTGTQPDGRFIAGEVNSTCRNWTHSGEGSAMVGHHDRAGPATLATATSWNSAHPSRGCGMDALRATGGAGQFYCFAAD
jgi:hypothetical protein